MDERLLLLLSSSDKRDGSDVLRRCLKEKVGLLLCDDEALVGGEADWPRDERLKELEMRSRKEVWEERG